MRKMSEIVVKGCNFRKKEFKGLTVLLESTKTMFTIDKINHEMTIQCNLDEDYSGLCRMLRMSNIEFVENYIEFTEN